MNLRRHPKLNRLVFGVEEEPIPDWEELARRALEEKRYWEAYFNQCPQDQVEAVCYRIKAATADWLNAVEHAKIAENLKKRGVEV